MHTELTFEQLESFSRKWRENPDKLVFQASIIKNGIKAATENPASKLAFNLSFPTKLLQIKFLINNKVEDAGCLQH